jgi:hypothetical protein
MNVACGNGTINKRNMKHGWSGTSTYQTWSRNRTRCNNSFDANYMDYGQKGIRVCSRWDEFLKFLEDMGPKPDGSSLRRTNKKGYFSPENCKWIVK